MIKCVAIDDEPIALEIIRDHCRRHGDIDLRTFTSPVLGMECVDSWKPDVVFLDIQLNSHNGLMLAKRLPENICLIFTTAFAEYALDGFDANAVDFLHKPIFYPRFVQAMEKTARYLRPDNDKCVIDTITLKVEHKNVIVNLDDIILIEAMDNYVKIFRRDMPMIMSQITMKEMETILPPERFVRIHRSFIVAVGAIEKYSNRTIYLKHFSRSVPVGRKYVATFNNLSHIISNIK